MTPPITEETYYTSDNPPLGDSSGTPGRANPTGRIQIDVQSPTSVAITWESWGAHVTYVRIYNVDDNVNPVSGFRYGETLRLNNLKPNTRYRANFQGINQIGGLVGMLPGLEFRSKLLHNTHVKRKCVIGIYSLYD